MADASLSIIPGTGLFLDQNFPATVYRSLHDHSPELADLEYDAIYGRTPQRTGALAEGLTKIAYTSTNTDDLALIYFDDQTQIDEWGRVYAPYQEGGQFGLPTYTNPPREMIGSSLTDDIPQIQAWGENACQEALDLCANGQGIHI